MFVELTQGIPYGEIDAYCRLTGKTVSPFEVVLLQRINRAARNAQDAGRKAMAAEEARESRQDYISKRSLPLSQPKRPQRGMKRKA